MNGSRRSYEARVLVIPQGPSALATQEAMQQLGLDGVMSVCEIGPAAASGDGQARAFQSHPLARNGWRAPSSADRVGDLVAGADMVVLLAADLSEVRAEICREAAEATRADGVLIAALVVRPDNWDTPAGNTAMVVLREAVDMLVVVRGPELAAPFLDVLRGGRREPALTA